MKVGHLEQTFSSETVAGVRRILRRLLTRFHDVLLSVYLYNERQGYIYLDLLAQAFAEKYPNEVTMLEAIRKHANDEHKHYLMFQHWFRIVGRMPFVIPVRVGYCEGIVFQVLGQTLDEINPAQIVNNDRAFFQLCRIVMITERRGLRQVGQILKNPLVRREPSLVRIFEVIRADEPSHFEPYAEWLRRHGQARPSIREFLGDLWVHLSLVYFRIPLLFINPKLSRMEALR